MEHNRQTGKWLQNVKQCPHKAKPCGNPIDADEAMRAAQILEANPNDRISQLQAEQALRHAHSIASNCIEPKCPLETHFNTNRHKALKILAGTD